ncbi:hypothetical protein ppKF707_2294 [Metapseudomonas furukawaii]|nr:hypothetical protein ppKF707_2294 [Pseudomonas furukawaii]
MFVGQPYHQKPQKIAYEFDSQPCSNPSSELHDTVTKQPAVERECHAGGRRERPGASKCQQQHGDAKPMQ